jgi:hypothetical protein
MAKKGNRITPDVCRQSRFSPRPPAPAAGTTLAPGIEHDEAIQPSCYFDRWCVITLGA